MSRRSASRYSRRHGGLRRRLRRIGHQLARRRRTPRPPGLERLRARARGAARRLHLHVRRPDAARLHARGAGVVASALHRLGRVRRAEGRARPPRRRVREHRPADGNGVSRRVGRLHHDLARGQRRRARPVRRPATARPGRRSSTRSWRTPTSPSASCRTELWSGAGLSLGRKAYRRLGRRGLLEFAGGTLVSCRDWVTQTFRSDAAHGLLAPWVLHTGLGPGPGDVRVHDAGDRRGAPARRHARAGGRRRAPRRRARRHRPRRRR